MDDEIVAIVVVGSFFAHLVGLVWLALLYGARIHRERQQTLRLMVEKGTDIPLDLLVRRRSPMADLRRGLLLLAGGVGLLAFLMFFTAREAPRLWTVGLIPILVGAAFLVLWRLERRSDPSTA